jgi:hypothetical protein
MKELKISGRLDPIYVDTSTSGEAFATEESEEAYLCEGSGKDPRAPMLQ